MKLYSFTGLNSLSFKYDLFKYFLLTKLLCRLNSCFAKCIICQMSVHSTNICFSVLLSVFGIEHYLHSRPSAASCAVFYKYAKVSQSITEPGDHSVHQIGLYAAQSTSICSTDGS